MLAIRLARIVTNKLRECAVDVTVFNTSDSSYRFEPGEDAALLERLAFNIRESMAFLALVTPKSLAAASKFIEYEIKAALQVQRAELGREVFFFPCVADGATLGELPHGSGAFVGVNLD